MARPGQDFDHRHGLDGCVAPDEWCNSYASVRGEWQLLLLWVLATTVPATTSMTQPRGKRGNWQPHRKSVDRQAQPEFLAAPEDTDEEQEELRLWRWCYDG